MGAAVAAVIIRKEKDLVAHFESCQATSVQTARTLDALGVERDRIFRRLQERAIIREGAPDFYYVDMLSWRAMNRTRRRIVFILLAVVLAAAAYLYLTASQRSVV